MPYPLNDLLDNDYAEHRLKMREQEANLSAPEGYEYGQIDPQAPGKYGRDIAKSIPHGIAQAVTNATDSIAALAASLDLQTVEDPTRIDPEKKKVYEPGSLTNPLEALAPETLPGKLTGGIAQFLTGFFPFLKLFRSLGAAGYIGELGAGMAADLTVFQPFEDNLANLVDKLPMEIKNPVLAYLAEPVRAVGEALKIEQDDTQVEARLKRMAEGLMMASIVDPFIKALRVIKQAGAGPAIARKVGKEAVEQTGISFIEHGAKAHEIHMSMGGVTYNVRTGENLAGQDALVMSIYEGRQVKVSGQPTSDQIAGYIEMNKDLLLGPDARVNLGTWYDPDEGATFLDVVATIPREHIEAAHGLGKEFDQKAAYDLLTGQDIPMKGTGQGIPSQIPEAERLAMVPTETTGTLKLQRYVGEEGLTELDPTLKKQYTGVSAAERGRLEGVLGEETVGAPHRLNYYLEGATHEPQVAAGRHLYEAEIPKGRIYNALMDPLGLRAEATPEGMVRAEANTYERLIKEAGYAGYVDPHLGHAAVWEKLPVKQIERTLPMREAADSLIKRLAKKAKESLRVLQSEAGWTEGRGLSAKEINRQGAVGAAYIVRGEEEFRTWMNEIVETVGEVDAAKIAKASEKRFDALLKQAPKFMERTNKILEFFHTGKGHSPWYAKDAPELQAIFGDDTDVFIHFLAATSGNRTVAANRTLALKAYRQWVLGGRKPIAPGDWEGQIRSHRKYLTVASKGEEFTTPKYSNFVNALRGDLDAVVIDEWMMRAFGFPTKNDRAPTALEYITLENIVRKMARDAGVRPAEMQEAIWVGIKTLEGLPQHTTDPFHVMVKRWLDENPGYIEELGLNYKPRQLEKLKPKSVPKDVDGLKKKLKQLGSHEFQHYYNPLNLEAGVVSRMVGRGIERATAVARVRPQIEEYTSLYNHVLKNTQAPILGTTTGLSHSDLVRVMGRIAAGGIGGGMIGDTPEDRIRNAAIGMGITGISPPLVRKMASWVRSSRAGAMGVMEGVPEGLPGARRATEGAETQTWDELIGMHRVPDEVQGTWDEFNALVNTFEWRTTKAKRGDVRVQAMAHWEGELLGWGIGDIKKMVRTFNLSDEQASALVNVMKKAGDATIRAARKWVETEAPEDLQNFLRLYNTFLEMDPKRLATKAEAGRSLGILNDPLAGYNRYLDQFSSTAEYGTHVGPNRLAQMVAELGDAEQLGRAFHKGMRPGLSDVLLEIWINGLLSGPSTHAVNFLGNSMVALWAIPERAIASRIGRSVHKGEATAMFFGMMHSTMDAWKLAARAFKEGRPVSGLQKIETRFRKAISSEAFGMEGGIWASFIDYMGEGIRLPGRFLLAGDEFAKTINSRMQAYALAYREGLSKGLEGKKFAEYVKANLDNMPSKIKEGADEFAAVQTFTNELGGFGQALSGIAESSGFARIILPFVKTPINIFKWTTERLPGINLFYKEVRADIAAGGVRRDMALAKMATGGMTMAMFATLAASGMITGRGPKNKVLKQAWEADGRREYSIYIPVLDQWVSYKRTDPVGMMMGLAADYVTICQQSDAETHAEWAETIAAATVAALSRNLASKTYMKGIADATEAITSEEPGKVEKWLRNFTGSFVPALVAQATRELDDVQREAHSITEKVLSRTPWLSKEVPPRRNIFGEIQHYTGALGPDWISPFYASDKQDPDPVMKEINKNETEVMMPPWSIDGIKISSKQRDKWIVLMNEVENEYGLTMKEQLQELINSEEYKEATEGPDGMQSEMIKKVIYTYKNIAYHELRKKDEELDLKLRKQEVENLQSKYGEEFDPDIYMEAIR